MYADDTHLTFASNNIETINDVMNHDLSNVNTWLTANKLTLNSSKTEFMLIGSRQRLGTYDTSPKLIIGGDIINQVSSVKSLGVHIDENLSWNMHIEKIAKKIASGIGAIKRCRPFINRTTLESVFNALVQPYFNYCSEVWGHCNKSLSNRLQKLQNRAARILTFSSYDTSADPIFEQLNWKRLDTQRQIQVATMVYKSIHGLAPDYTPNANMADRSVVARDESHEGEASEARMVCFDSTCQGKSCFVVDMVYFVSPSIKVLYS